MIIPFGHVLILAGLLFLMGILCVMTRRSLIMILLGVEIMLNAVAILLVGSS
ncbi:MAG: NADH-quinone oxidoreductase subunit NuoK, partial [Planctomycetota bacterium]